MFKLRPKAVLPPNSLLGTSFLDHSMASAIASAAHDSFITPLLFQRLVQRAVPSHRKLLQCFNMWGAGEERMAKEGKVLVLVLELGRRKGNRERKQG